MIRTTIYRYRLGQHGGLAAHETVVVPAGARVLTVARRDGTTDAVDLWAEVDPEQPDHFIQVQFVGTGWAEVPAPPARYVGTVQLADGGLVLHAYVTGDADTDLERIVAELALRVANGATP